MGHGLPAADVSVLSSNYRMYLTVFCSFIACAGYSMYVTGAIYELSSAVAVMSLDQRLLLALVLGSFCALLQAVVFPPSKYSTGVAQVRLTTVSLSHLPHTVPVVQIMPSIVCVSVVNELFFKSDIWPFGAPLASLQSLNAGNVLRPCRFGSRPSICLFTVQFKLGRRIVL
jgi:hypothetical protein